MEIDYQRICKDKRLYKSILGIDQTTYQKLIPLFTENLEKIKDEKIQTNPDRKRIQGGGSKPKIFDKPSKLLFYILFFTRNYPTFDIAKLFFKLDRCQLHYWYELGLEVLEKTVKHKIQLPAEKSDTLDKILKRVPELKNHILDATEQPINRPKENQEFYYSGKKKRHTIKRQILITPRKKLIGISYSVEGKKSDIELSRESKYLFNSPPNSTAITDLAYLSLKESHPKEMRQICPQKKPKGKELTNWQKEYNQSISSIRVRIEHVICHLKYFKIFSDKLRYRKRKYDNQIANIVGGLYNLKFE